MSGQHLSVKSCDPKLDDGAKRVAKVLAREVGDYCIPHGGLVDREERDAATSLLEAFPDLSHCSKSYHEKTVHLTSRHD